MCARRSRRSRCRPAGRRRRRCRRRRGGWGLGSAWDGELMRRGPGGERHFVGVCAAARGAWPCRRRAHRALGQARVAARRGGACRGPAAVRHPHDTRGKGPAMGALCRQQAVATDVRQCLGVRGLGRLATIPLDGRPVVRGLTCLDALARLMSLIQRRVASHVGKQARVSGHKALSSRRCLRAASPQPSGPTSTIRRSAPPTDLRFVPCASVARLPTPTLSHVSSRPLVTYSLLLTAGADSETLQSRVYSQSPPASSDAWALCPGAESLLPLSWRCGGTAPLRVSAGQEAAAPATGPS